MGNAKTLKQIFVKKGIKRKYAGEHSYSEMAIMTALTPNTGTFRLKAIFWKLKGRMMSHPRP